MRKILSLSLIAFMTTQCWVMGAGGENGGESSTNAMARMLGLTAAFSIRNAGGAASPASEPFPAPGPNIYNVAPVLLSPTSVFGIDRISQVSGIGSHDGRMYFGANSEIMAFDSTTSEIDLLTSNAWAGQYYSPPTSAKNFQIDGNYLYFTSQGQANHLQRVSTGNDAKHPVRRFVSQVACCNGATSVSANSTHLFWISFDGYSSSIYSKPLVGDFPPILLGTFAGGLQLRATHSVLYLSRTAGWGFDSAIMRYDLATGIVVTIQTNVSPLGYHPIVTMTEDRFYWVNDRTIYSVLHSSVTPDAVQTNISGIEKITVDGNALYALNEWGPWSQIHKVDLATGTSSIVVSENDIRAIGSHQGAVFWFTRLALHKIDQNGTGSTLYSNDGTQIGFENPAPEITILGGKVVKVSSERIFYYDLNTESSGIFRIEGLTCLNNCLASDGAFVYAYAWTRGILKIPQNINLRVPEVLVPQVGVVNAITLTNDWLYWSERDSSSIDRLRRVKIDGTNVQTLFTGEHRGLAVFENRIYFMCNGCTVPGWMLVSMDPAGGTVTPEVQLGLSPRGLVRKGNVFYITDQLVSSGARVIFALNMIAQRAVAIDTVQGSMENLVTSENALYVGSYGQVARYKINDWQSYGVREYVQTSGLMHISGSTLYLWSPTNGLQKIDE